MSPDAPKRHRPRRARRRSALPASSTFPFPRATASSRGFVSPTSTRATDRPCCSSTPSRRGRFSGAPSFPRCATRDTAAWCPTTPGSDARTSRPISAGTPTTGTPPTSGPWWRSATCAAPPSSCTTGAVPSLRRGDRSSRARGGRGRQPLPPSRSPIATRQPAPAQARAVARLIPRAAPVMATTRPSRAAWLTRHVVPLPVDRPLAAGPYPDPRAGP